ncbi:MAG: ATP-grasp domain-containing protein [SAR202 cluster bacterium]|nr:ATP-grasp domain-containing protein [SAR202 cluster bacterium]
MFSKVLIANRGEVARRIARTCRRLGVSTVAVYSGADAGHPHSRDADESYRLKSASSSQSYLNIPALLDVAQRSGAEAVHPGYGFLSESPEFAEACRKVGLVFIGPPPEVMRRVSNKVQARLEAVRAGVNTITATQSFDDPRKAMEMAEHVGFPLIIKVTSGGGGYGMRVVRTPDNLLSAFDQSLRTATGLYGKASVHMERYIHPAAHVEVQIFGDGHGSVLHLNERDCSVQRRHQKVIEEAPSPRLDSALKHRIVSDAVSLMRHVGYVNAGTVEFLVDPQGRHYFMEVNCRLQVEHPITEEITGVDLVEMQLRAAAGEPLKLSQDQVTPRCHAIEARVFAEDPYLGTLSVGEVTDVSEPAGEGLRLESAVFSGYKVTPSYDPLVAKLIAKGGTRQQAIQRLVQGLESFRIGGIQTNIPLLLAVLKHPEFLSGGYTLDFLEAVMDDRLKERKDRAKAAAVAVTFALEERGLRL